MVDENPYRSPESADPTPRSGWRWSQATIPPGVLAIVFILGVLQYWTIGLLLIYRVVAEVPHGIEFGTYLIHWSSAGGLIGFAVSKKGILGSLIGFIIGFALSLGLMSG